MSRILIVGMGVPGFVASRHHAGPGLRAAHFASALAGAGHEVLLLAVLAPDEAAPAADGPAPPVRVEYTGEPELLSASMRRRIDAFAPDAVVGVTVYAAALAVRLARGVPLWADVFGDLMAEAQAKAARSGSDWSVVHFWTLLRGVLEQADRFSAVSGAQMPALVGQLGMAGRLSSRTAGEALVSTIPCAAEIPAEGAGREASRLEFGFDRADFVLLVSGGVNTWCDVETLGRGIALAMDAEPRLRLVVTGGSIPGHDEASGAALLAALRAIDRTPAGGHAGAGTGSRVQVLGWIESSRLPALYAAADLALHIERPLYERMLGAENRVIEWLAHALPCVTTALSETGGALVARGIAFGCKVGNADDLARAIGEAVARPAAVVEAGRRGRGWLAGERSYARTAAPLLEWCKAPRFAGDRDGARLVRLGLLSHPETSVEMLEAYVAALPAREIARRGLRWLVRRGVRWFARPVRAGTTIVRSAADALPAAKDPASGQRPPRASSLPRIGMLVLMLASMATGGCTKTGPSHARPNILLLSIDTLRLDHLGTYGYAVRPSPSPWIDRLAAGGTVFEQAVTSAPETAPALATLVTGVYQDRHGVLYNRARLGDENHTLAERLKEGGYATAAFLGNWLVDAEHGFGQGFDRITVVQSGAPATTSIDDRLVALFGAFLREPPAPGPWFAWVHMMDPHGPYNSASPWWSRDFDYSAAPVANDGEFPLSDSNFGLGVIPFYQKLEGARRLSDYVRRYDGEIRYTDSQVGSLLGMLAATGAADNTVVVLVADHGESLVEHDELLQHGWFVYDTTVRVPLIVSWPAGLPRPARVPEQVCSVDITPTLLELAGIDAGAEEFDGRSLAPRLGAAAGGRAAASAHTSDLRDAGCFSIGPRPDHPISLRAGRYKMIVTPAGAPTDPRAPKGEPSSAPERVEVYDLTEDPGETANLASARGDLADEMLQPIAKMRARFRASGWRW